MAITELSNNFCTKQTGGRTFPLKKPTKKDHL